MKERTATTGKAKSAAHSDGRPLDVIQYLEAKLVLKPDQLTSLESFREFGRLVARTAEQLQKVDFIPDMKARRPNIREIIFFDTTDYRLYNNAFILRQRVTYVDGFPDGDPEIVLKFRHPDEKTAAVVDVRPKISGQYEIKFKSEVLPLKDQVGGFRVLYSHNCQFGLSQVHEPASTAMAVLARIFPALSVVRKHPDESVCLVNQEIVEEVLLPLGQIDFHKGQVAKCDIALWRTRGEHKPLIGEFAFQAKFDRREDVDDSARKRAEQFFISMQQASQAWLALGCTKTAAVYRLKGNRPQSHE